jgi:excisionase family DNA binding protein
VDSDGTAPPGDQADDAENPASDSMNTNLSGEFFTMDEVARLKGVSYHTVSRAVRKGTIRSKRMGRMALVSAEDLSGWEPVRSRAPRKYRQRVPDPTITPAVMDLASGERIELARRLSALYEVIHSTAMQQPLEVFAQVLAESFSKAMEFPRIAIWIVNDERTTTRRVASLGEWYVEGQPPIPDELPFLDQWDRDTAVPRVFEVPAIDYLAESKNLQVVEKFMVTPLRVGAKLIGFIGSDRNGLPLELSEAQGQIAQGLATQAALALDLNRTRQAERIRRDQLEATLARTRAVADVSLQLNQGDDLLKVLRNAAHRITQLMGGERGGIGLQREQEELIGMWTFSGDELPDKVMHVNLRTYPGTERAFRNGKATLTSYGAMSGEEQQILDEAGIRSNLITPFIIDGELVGAMYVLYADEFPNVTDEDLEFNDAIAAQCLVAIKQVRLQEQLEAEHRALDAARIELQRLAGELNQLRSVKPSNRRPDSSRKIDDILTLIEQTVTRTDVGPPLTRAGD